MGRFEKVATTAALSDGGDAFPARIKATPSKSNFRTEARGQMAGPGGMFDGGEYLSMPNCEPWILPDLEAHGLTRLEEHPNVVYGLSPDWNLSYLNPAWHRFALENGGGEAFLRDWGLGRSLLDGISSNLRIHYQMQLDRSLRRATAWEQIYTCPSPLADNIYRLSLKPLSERRGLLAIHTLLQSRPFGPELCRETPNPADYEQSSGLIVQCSYCRKVRRVAETETWEWVMTWIERSPDNTSHSICPPCAESMLSQFEKD